MLILQCWALACLLCLLCFGGSGHARRAVSKAERVYARGGEEAPRRAKTRAGRRTPHTGAVVPLGAAADVSAGSPLGDGEGGVAAAALPPAEDDEDEGLLQRPFPEELSDGSTLVVTVDGRISRLAADGTRLWTAEAGGPVVTSFQGDGRGRERPYAIIPQLDGRGLVHLQGKGKKTFTKIPMSVKAFADLVPQYSHTPDGINYRRAETQLLVYVDWETGASDVLGCEDPADTRCHRGMAPVSSGNSRAQLFLTRATTTIYATDVYTREPIFNFSYSEFRPVSMLHPHRVTGPRGGPLLPARGLRVNDTLDSFSDGSVLGPMGRARMDTLVFDAFRVSQSAHQGPLSAAMGNSLGGAAEDLVVSAPRYPYDPTVIFRKVPIKQHFGNPGGSSGGWAQGQGQGGGPEAVAEPQATVTGGNSYYAYASSDSGVCDAAVSRVLESEGAADVLAPDGSGGDLISVVNGGSEFGLFAVTYSSTQQTAPWVRSLLPPPEHETGDAEFNAGGGESRGVCFPADSANGFYFGPYAEDPTCDGGAQGSSGAQWGSSGAAPWGRDPASAQCSASASYFIHEIVSPADRSGLYAPLDAGGPGGAIGSSAVDLDMLFDNAARSSAGSKPAEAENGNESAVLPVPTDTVGDIAATAVVRETLFGDIYVAIAVLMAILGGLLWRRQRGRGAALQAPASRPLHIDTGGEPLLTDPSRVARVVGNIHITENLLGVGSSGTLVYFGYTSELGVMRPAAIKQMLRSNYSHAIKEIANLKKIDTHDNIVNYYMCEQNDNFVFLALQLCRMNLKDFVVRLEQRLPPGVLRLRLCPAHADSTRAALLQAAEAIEFLHRRGVLHRDIKPHNILMEEVKGKPSAPRDGYSMFAGGDIEISDFADMARFKMRVSDFGLSKDVKTEEVSFGSLSVDGSRAPPGQGQPDGTADCGEGRPSKPPGSARHWDAVGTIGWQAPELIKRRLRKTAASSSGGAEAGAEADTMTMGDPLRLTSKVDIFSLGCVFHFALVPGCHPFGHWRDREDNILNNVPDLTLLTRTPDAFDLVSAMIHCDPARRPTAREVCFHPFFWPSQKRLDFWEALYCRLKRESSKSRLLREFEAYADPVVCRNIGAMSEMDKQTGLCGWGADLDVAFQREIANPPHGITYDVSSIYSCIRFIRHKKSHFDELDGRLRALLNLPEGYMRYFESRLPLLFTYCVWFATTHFAGEKEFKKFDLLVLLETHFYSPAAPPHIISPGYAAVSAVPRLQYPGGVSAQFADASTPPTCERRIPEVVACTLRALDCLQGGTQTESPDIPPRRQRGFYGWPPLVRAGQSEQDGLSEQKPVVRASPEPSRDSLAGQWARGVTLSASSPTLLQDCVDSGLGDNQNDTTMSLIYSNIYIPPVSNANRPLHVKKALENERYRTELCREWEDSGKEFFRTIQNHSGDRSQRVMRQCCKFRRGQKQCDYAHGRLELRVKGMQRVTTGVCGVGRYVGGDVVDAWGGHHHDDFRK